MGTELFDDWAERYEAWFRTPTGRVVLETEVDLVAVLLAPQAGEVLLDAGCGTGLFSRELPAAGVRVAGLDRSRPMLTAAARAGLLAVRGDLRALPFPDERFDRTVSVTAVEFTRDAERVVRELFRVTRPGGVVVVATLNRLSPWARRRERRARVDGGSIFRDAVFRSPAELLALAPVAGTVATRVHFAKEDPPARARELEARGVREGLDTGAFVAARWVKPGQPDAAPGPSSPVPSRSRQRPEEDSWTPTPSGCT